MYFLNQNQPFPLYPFGMTMPGRSFTNESYRFGFNGMEKDDEIKGIGNSLDFGARIYDSRLGRWLSVDPLQKKYPGFSPYIFAINNPLCWIDKDGRDIIPTNWFIESGYNVVLSKMIKNNLTFYTKYLKEYHTSHQKNLIFQYNNKPFTDAAGNTTPSGDVAPAQGSAFEKPSTGGVIRFSIQNENIYEFGVDGEEQHKKYKSKEITKAAIMIHEMIFHVSEGREAGIDHIVSQQEIRDAVNMLMEYSNKILPADQKIDVRSAAILTLNGMVGASEANFNSYLNQINNEFGLNLTKNQIISENLNVGYEVTPTNMSSSDVQEDKLPEIYGDKQGELESNASPMFVN